MAPRKRKQVTLVTPEDLLPKLPDPDTLHPFPSWECYAFQGHTSRITDLDVHRGGELLLSSDMGGNLMVWEHIGIQLWHQNYDKSIKSCRWNPRSDVYVIMVGFETKINLIWYDHGDESTKERHLSLFKKFKNADDKSWNLLKSEIGTGISIDLKHVIIF
ncbi:Ribosome biogenesis protein erb1 [Thelohanellus kitauei]|uniref:Ribosome biogenesis protein erb1 n=1 Tax=Thelohanellus kitauei TaxID=669202 RepID=A0A0C2N4B6_THEKT|nr:Ribosome biogenesis protein erb1 [Thelohanellus kitauei]